MGTFANSEGPDQKPQNAACGISSRSSLFAS